MIIPIAIYLMVCAWIIHADRSFEDYNFGWKQTQGDIQIKLTIICGIIAFILTMDKIPYIDTGLFAPDIGPLGTSIYLGIGGSLAICGPISLIHMIYRPFENRYYKKKAEQRNKKEKV